MSASPLIEAVLMPDSFDTAQSMPLPEPTGNVLTAVPATPEAPAVPQTVKVQLNGQPYTEIPMTPEAIQQYVENKEAYIRQIQSQNEMAMQLLQNQNRSQQTAPAQPTGDPVATKRAEILANLLQDYKDIGMDVDPKGLKPVVDSQLRLWQESQKTLQEYQTQTSYDTEYFGLRAQDPSFDLANPLVQRVISEFPGRSPREHFALFRQYYAPQVPNLPATPAFTGANGATNGNRPHYAAPPMGASPVQPGATGDSQFVLQQVQAARQAQCTDAEVMSIRQRAIQIERSQR